MRRSTVARTRGITACGPRCLRLPHADTDGRSGAEGSGAREHPGQSGGCAQGPGGGQRRFPVEGGPLRRGTAARGCATTAPWRSPARSRRPPRRRAGTVRLRRSPKRSIFACRTRRPDPGIRAEMLASLCCSVLASRTVRVGWCSPRRRRAIGKVNPRRSTRARTERTRSPRSRPRPPMMQQVPLPGEPRGCAETLVAGCAPEGRTGCALFCCREPITLRERAFQQVKQKVMHQMAQIAAHRTVAADQRTGARREAAHAGAQSAARERGAGMRAENAIGVMAHGGDARGGASQGAGNGCRSYLQGVQAATAALAATVEGKGGVQ